MSIDDIRSGDSIETAVKIRYHHPAVPAVIERTGADEARISFAEAVKAPAPGQAAVFYDSEMRVMGGGTISR
jgi:tRNA-specific 2-thiouridylase